MGSSDSELCHTNVCIGSCCQSQSCQEYWIGGSTNVAAPPSPNTSHISYFDSFLTIQVDYILFVTNSFYISKLKICKLNLFFNKFPFNF